MSNYITTRHFMEEVRKMGFEVFLNNFYGSIEVFNKETKNTLAYVSSNCNMGLNTIHRHWDNFNDETKTKLYNLLDRYARTPLDKREEQKKYRLKLDISDQIDFDDKYLCELISPKGYVLESRKYCSKFSQSEIDEMGDLTRGFVKEEVCEN